MKYTCMLINIGDIVPFVLHGFFLNSGLWGFIFKLIECVTSIFSANIDRTCKYTVRHLYMIILYIEKMISIHFCFNILLLPLLNVIICNIIQHKF